MYNDVLVKPEVKLILFIFLISLVLGCAVLVAKSKDASGNILSPFAKESSFFSLFRRHEKPKKIIYGYLPYWSLEKIQYLRLDELTHLAYFGAYLGEDGNFEKTALGEDGSTVFEPGYNNWQDNKELGSLIEKCKQEGVRVALTVIAHTDEKIDNFLDCRECWNTFLNNLVAELNVRGINDVNLNFEYAGETDPKRATEFSELTKFINEQLDSIYGDSFVVVSAFADSAETPRVSSDLDNLGRYADGIFIMGYDFHRPLSDEVGPVSPVAGNKQNLTTTIDAFLAKVPPNKIILGVPYYGYNWEVESDDPNAKTLRDIEGYARAESQSYESVMDTILEVDPELKWNEEGKSPYFTYTSPDSGELRTVYFENEESLKAKYELIKVKNLAGVGIWALGYDGGYNELWELLYDEFIR
jgi:spore germination protein